MNDLGFVKAIDRFSVRIVIGVADTAMNQICKCAQAAVRYGALPLQSCGFKV